MASLLKLIRSSLLLILMVQACSCGVFGQEKTPQLYIVDRSQDNDGLYYCSVRMLKADNVESIALLLKDRKDKKVGDMLLSTIDTSPTETMAAFFLNHEFIKTSYVIVVFSDDRKNLKFVLGENLAIKKVDGKTVRVPIE